MEQARIAIRSKGGGDDCPYCRDALSGRGAVCATCLAVHHVECWQEHGRCAGCAWTRALMPPEVVLGARDPADPPAAAPEEPPGEPRLRVTPLCDLEEACLLLGAREEEVWRLIAAGHLLARKEGQRFLCDRQEVARVRDHLLGLRRREALSYAAREAGQRRAGELVRCLGWGGGLLALGTVGWAWAVGGPVWGRRAVALYLALGVALLLLGWLDARARRRRRASAPDQ